MTAIDHFPLLLIFAGICAAGFVSVEIGFLLGGWYRKEEGLDKYPIESTAANTVLGLLAFLLAFVFGATASRYSDRRELARLDHEAIADVYQLSDFLPEAERAKVRDHLLEYHSARMAAIASGELAEVERAMGRSAEIQDELWAIAVAARMANESSILNQVVTAVDELGDAHSARAERALVTRMPGIIWWSLGVLTFLSSVLLGFSSGLHGRRSRLSSSLVIVSFVAVLTMVIDLDRPFHALFGQTSGATSAAELLETMRADAADRGSGSTR